MNIDGGNISSRAYNCEFPEDTTVFTPTTLTLSEMKLSYEGEYNCTITLADYATDIPVTQLNVNVNGKVLYFHSWSFFLCACLPA